MSSSKSSRYSDSLPDPPPPSSAASGTSSSSFIECHDPSPSNSRSSPFPAFPPPSARQDASDDFRPLPTDFDGRSSLSQSHSSTSTRATGLTLPSHSSHSPSRLPVLEAMPQPEPTLFLPPPPQPLETAYESPLLPPRPVRRPLPAVPVGQARFAQLHPSPPPPTTSTDAEMEAKRARAAEIATERGLDELEDALWSSTERSGPEGGDVGAARRGKEEEEGVSPVSPTGTTLPQYPSSSSSAYLSRSVSVLKREASETARATAFGDEKAGRAVEEVRRLVREETARQVHEEAAEMKQRPAASLEHDRSGDEAERRRRREEADREVRIRKRMEELRIEEEQEMAKEDRKGRGSRGESMLPLVGEKAAYARPPQALFSSREQAVEQQPPTLPTSNFLLPPPPPPVSSSYLESLHTSSRSAASSNASPAVLPLNTVRHSSLLPPTALYVAPSTQRHSSLGPASSFYSPGMASVTGRRNESMHSGYARRSPSASSSDLSTSPLGVVPLPERSATNHSRHRQSSSWSQPGALPPLSGFDLFPAVSSPTAVRQPVSEPQRTPPNASLSEFGQFPPAPYSSTSLSAPPLAPTSSFATSRQAPPPPLPPPPPVSSPSAPAFYTSLTPGGPLLPFYPSPTANGAPPTSYFSPTGKAPPSGSLPPVGPSFPTSAPVPSPSPHHEDLRPWSRSSSASPSRQDDRGGSAAAQPRPQRLSTIRSLFGRKGGNVKLGGVSEEL